MNINELKEGTYIAKNKIDSSTHLVRITGKFPMLRIKRALCIDSFSDITEKNISISENIVTSIETEPEDYDFFKLSDIIIEAQKASVKNSGIDKYKVLSEKRDILANLLTSGKEEEAITIVVSEEGISIADARDVLNMFRLNI